MAKQYGSQSMMAPLRKVLVKRPDEVFAVADPVAWHYTGRPDLATAQQEHDGLVALLRQAGTEVFYHDEVQPGHADAIYAFDPALVTDHGAIMLSMGKAQRRGEEEIMARRFESLGVPAVPDEEFMTMGTNVLATAPGKCLMLEGNPITQRYLEEAGCEVVTYRGNEISLKAEGGPTCLTRPILRD